MSSQDKSQAQDDNAIVNEAVAQGGAYEVIRQRLVDQAQQLHKHTQSLNEARISEFGSPDMSVLARVRVRTENNCVARDIVEVGQHLLFGYNVFIGLKRETKVDDVFSLYTITQNDDQYELTPVTASNTFLTDPRFVSDFDELYRYYKHTKLIQLSVRHGKLLAGFQIGEKLEDVRVFRWSVSADGKDISYIDNRGERDLALPPPYDFEWVNTTREDIVHSRHPHINIEDTLFISNNKGFLNIKIEDNTEEGMSVFREKVEDDTQSLDDLSVSYAITGKLILLKILPYREQISRYFVYNTLTQTIQRIDAIGQSCVQLPEDHGIIFPGGYYLESGEHKTFDEQYTGLMFKRSFRSPNGEDVLYIFYEPVEGVVGLFAYNMINKTLKNPIYGHGYAQFDNGLIIIFSSEGEPTRVHPMQLWQTPFFSAEYASALPDSQTPLGKIGNAELVRGISDLFSICRIVDNQSVSMRLYEELTRITQKIFDDYYWLTQDNFNDIKDSVNLITATAELVIDEFEKVESIRQQSAKTLQKAQEEQEKIISQARPDNWESAEQYVNALRKIRQQRGHLSTISDYRYIDKKKISDLDQELVKIEEKLSEKTVTFLVGEEALTPYFTKVEQLDHGVETANTIAELTPIIEAIEGTTAGLDVLSELMGTLQIDDATVRTRIIDSISEVYAKLNQSKAQANHRRKSLGSQEAVAQFSAQFKLFSQSITNALGLATTPDKCDEQLSRLLARLEELESQFSDFEDYLADIITKREEVYQAFEAHKQQLLDERQRKSQAVMEATNRILSSIEKRSLKFTDPDELNTYFASDSLVAKVREFVERLRDLNSAVQADDVEARFKSIKEQSIRALRDKTDIYEEGGNVIKLGPRHKFSVNTQELDLTLFPKEGVMNVHLTGTDFYEPIKNEDLDSLKAYWGLAVESETPQLYRAEYLAGSIIRAAQNQTDGLTIEILNTALLDDNHLSKLVRDFATPRYKEGYEKGIHDHDATLLLKKLLPAIASADLLTFDPTSRALAQVFWASIEQRNISGIAHRAWIEQAQSAVQLNEIFASHKALDLLIDDVETALKLFLERHPLALDTYHQRRAAHYLVLELGRDRLDFITSKYAENLAGELKRSLTDEQWRQYQKSLDNLSGQPNRRWQLTNTWLNALIENKQLGRLAHYLSEAIAFLIIREPLSRRSVEVDLEIDVQGLLGNHSRIVDRGLLLSVDNFLQRFEQHCTEVIPSYHRYLALRQQIAERERKQLRLDSFKPKPLSSFVRNRLINEAYLPIIGDNLAKQMGTVGESKRTDLMGLLMMISPPGYGKTTLMEYVASRLGLIFMKINCPSLGHDVTSLDPAQAPNATAKQELNKINLSFEMGNNVMLYLDDIQHTHPEFLQKFISLCDGTRRIDGVWNGETKTYDMRGRKFCVVMAGNPYTESGEVFKIPDMLANRADIYNLGDILGGMDEQFALSYIENALTSNPVLAPLALRELSDVYKLVRMSQGENVPSTDLSYSYSGAEINEITQVLKKLFVIQDVVLKINQQYIASAAQDDKYRTEPAFKLQGSYRNMNKMAEKVSAVMNDEELMAMIADHYLGEAQLLTTGAEANLLKLSELRGNMTQEQHARWQAIKADFLRNKAMGGDETDTGNKMVVQLNDIVNSLKQLGVATQSSGQSLTSVVESINHQNSESQQAAIDQLSNIVKGLQQLGKITNSNGKSLAALVENLEKEEPLLLDEATQPQSESSQMVEALVQALEKIETVGEGAPNEIAHSLAQLTQEIDQIAKPLIKKMDKKLSVDLRTYFRVTELSKKIIEMNQKSPAKKATKGE